jgi:hypothetical protein
MSIEGVKEYLAKERKKGTGKNSLDIFFKFCY